jgi:hypothetical protein
MTPKEYFETELANNKRAFDEGYYPALLDAFALCVMNNQPLPDWVWRRVADHLETGFASKRQGGGSRGRTGGRRAAAEMDFIHYFRWNWARHWLANRKELKHYGHEPTRDGAFAYTSESLQGTRAQGSAGAIRGSHMKVEKARKSGKFARYKSAGDDLRGKSGPTYSRKLATRKSR